MSQRRASLLLILIASLALPPHTAEAQASSDEALPAVLGGEVGWGGWIRQGRWNLARADVQSQAPMAVEFEWYVPQIGRRSMRIDLGTVLNPRPRTIQAFLPVGPAPQAIHLNVRSIATGRLLGHWQDPEASTLPERLVSENVLFVGVAGEGETVSALGDPRLAIGIEHEQHLPSSLIGYDAFDVLLLDRVNLEALSDAQELAVLDWVHAGGRALLQLDMNILPDASPILNALPARPRRVTGADGATRIELTTASELPITAIPVGSGELGLLHVDLRRLPSEARADLIQQFGARERSANAPAAGPALPLHEPRSRRSGIILLALAVLVGPIDALLARLGGRRLRRWTLTPAIILAIGGTALLVVSRPPTETWIPALEGVAPPAAVKAVARPGAIAAALDEAEIDDAQQWWRLGGAPRAWGPLVDIDFEQTPTQNIPASGKLAPYQIELR